MKAESREKPTSFYVERIGNTAKLHFCENVTEIKEGGEFKYAYDEYVVDVSVPEGLTERVERDPVAWSEYAKRLEIEALAQKIRHKRQKLLESSDWTQGSDSPLDAAKRQAWARYRTQLRDITLQSGFPYSVDFPKKPQ